MVTPHELIGVRSPSAKDTNIASRNQPELVIISIAAQPGIVARVVDDIVVPVGPDPICIAAGTVDPIVVRIAENVIPPGARIIRVAAIIAKNKITVGIAVDEIISPFAEEKI